MSTVNNSIGNTNESTKFLARMYKGKAFKGEFRKLVEDYLENGDWLFAIKTILKGLKQDKVFQVEAVALALFVASRVSYQAIPYRYSDWSLTLKHVSPLMPALFKSFNQANSNYLKQRAVECVEMALTCVDPDQVFEEGWSVNLETAAWALLITLDRSKPVAVRGKKQKVASNLSELSQEEYVRLGTRGPIVKDDRLEDPDSFGK